ncbi:MAG: hypothetical protein GX072_05550 [Lysinibacillus sp.]|nr:hypothetical protein [Lysinibacillus sp.]
MGFWYFLILFIGFFFIILVLIKRTLHLIKKLTIGAIGIAMIAFSLFMFLDGSAEIVDNLLKSFNIHL